MNEILTIDVGNTGIKLGQFNFTGLDQLPSPYRVLNLDARAIDFDGLADWLPSQACRTAVISVYRDACQSICDALRARDQDWPMEQLGWKDLGISVDLRAPDRVGLDRLAAARAACHLKPKDSMAIVIDAGSALTIDLISAADEFLGGCILCGRRLAAEALTQGTDQLPIAATSEQDAPPPTLGKDTEAAIQSGLFWGSVGSIREIVQRMRDACEAPLPVYLTGGDMQTLQPHLGLGTDCHYVPHLVLAGVAMAAHDRGREQT